MDKIYNCKLCKRTLVKRYPNRLCRECYLSNSFLFKPDCKKGKEANGFSNGNYVNRIKKCIACKKPIKNMYAKKCHSCALKNRWKNKTHKITNKTLCEHHLDLNTKITTKLIN